MAHSPPKCRGRKSSVFEIPDKREIIQYGNSMTEYAWEPHEEGPGNSRKAKKILYENTYKMAPTNKFRPDIVLPIIEQTLEGNLDGRRYDSMDCALLAKEISEDIKQQVLELHYSRYKIICFVTIGEKNEQGLYMGSRFLWDAVKDNYATASWSNRYLYGVGSVYALYFE